MCEVIWRPLTKTGIFLLLTVFIFGASPLGVLGQDANTLKIKKIEREQSPEVLEIRKIDPLPEVESPQRKAPRPAPVRVEDKALEPGEDGYRIRIDEIGTLYRVNEKGDKMVIGDSTFDLAPDVVFIVGDDQYATPPESMLGGRVGYRIHPESGLVTEVRRHEDLKKLESYRKKFMEPRNK